MARTAGPVAEQEEVEEREALPRWLAPFSSLRYRDFALLWMAQLTSGLGMWMEIVGRSWLVLELTGSATHLAGVNLARAIPQLAFGLIAGVAADRVDRQKLVLASMTANMLLTFAMAVLIVTGLMQVWHLYAYSVVMGVVMAFQMPVRQAIIPTVVPRKDLMNAFALNNGAMNVTRVIGPVAAGFIIVGVGISGAFFAKAAIFVAALAFMAMVRLPKAAAGGYKDSALQSFVAGMRYAFVENVPVRVILVLTLIPMVFAMPYMNIMPLFAKEVLGADADWYGILMGASGVGALAGSFVLASLGDFRRKGVLLLGGAFAFGISLLMTAFTSWMPMSMVMLIFVGLSMTIFTTVSNTLLMMLTPEEMRGRVLSVYMLDMGLGAFGAMFAGILADLTNVSLALAVMGGICAVLAAGTAVAVPMLRRL